MDSHTSTIYIPLLEEGTSVLRPTQALPLGGDLFRVLPTPDYDPDDETWQYPPGAIVRCAHQVNDGDEILVACARVG